MEAPVMTEAERIAKEQEEIRRAMAERHLAMQQKQEEANAAAGFSMTATAGSGTSTPATNNTLSPSTSAIWSSSKNAVELPPPPPSPKEVFEKILENFSKDAKKAMDKVLHLRQQRNMLLDERFVALAKERLAVQQISHAESQQTTAAEAEDFDLADQLQMVIDSLTRERAETNAILENIGNALNLLESQTPAVVKKVAHCFEKVQNALKEFQQQQTHVERLDDNDVSENAVFVLT